MQKFQKYQKAIIRVYDSSDHPGLIPSAGVTGFFALMTEELRRFLILETSKFFRYHNKTKLELWTSDSFWYDMTKKEIIEMFYSAIDYTPEIQRHVEQFGVDQIYFNPLPHIVANLEDSYANQGEKLLKKFQREVTEYQGEKYLARLETT